MCCMRFAANTGRKKLPKSRHLGIIAQLCRDISLQLRHVSTIEKNLLSSNISSTCPHNMVNLGPLAAEITSLVWGTPANFNRFHFLAALLHGTLGLQPNFAVLNRGRHLYSAGQPSRWVLAHILVIIYTTPVSILISFLSLNLYADDTQLFCLSHFTRPTSTQALLTYKMP